jgi:hypothetical protein
MPKKPRTFDAEMKLSIVKRMLSGVWDRGTLLLSPDTE